MISMSYNATVIIYLSAELISYILKEDKKRNILLDGIDNLIQLRLLDKFMKYDDENGNNIGLLESINNFIQELDFEELNRDFYIYE